jgi:hypothetical protein
MKKGPICYIYHTIKNKRQLKVEQEKVGSKNEEMISCTEFYHSRQ